MYRCLDKDVVIKVVLRDGDFIKDKESLKQYEKSVLNLSFKPIERHFPMSIPLVTLREKQGYVMKMAEGYEPLKTFLKKPSILENEEKDWIFRINNAIQELCKDNHIYGFKFKLLLTNTRIEITIKNTHPFSKTSIQIAK
ncbi:hypothetical protein HpRN161_12680 [Helicobacter pylori]